MTPAPLLVDRTTAAQMLAMSVDSAERHVFGELRTVRVGRRASCPSASWSGGTSATRGARRRPRRDAPRVTATGGIRDPTLEPHRELDARPRAR